MNNVDNNKNKKRNVPDKQTKILNVPKLRFPEFQGEWEKCNIGDFGNIVTGNTPPTKDVENYKNGQYLWVSPADLGLLKFVTETKTKLSKKGFDKTRVLPGGSVLVTCIGSTIGKMGMTTKETSTNQQINAIVVNQINNNEFVYYAVQSTFPKYLSSIAVQAVPIISKSSFELLPNYRPTIQEQEKIGKLLSLLDERIATQSKVIEKLQSLMKGIGDELFCSPKQPNPRLSPDGFADEYRNFHLKDFAYRINRKNKDNACSLVLTIAAQYGLVNQEKFFNKSIASANLKGYYLLHKGEFAYNKSYSTGYPWGAVKRLNAYEEGLLSPLYICFSVNGDIVDPDYLSFYFETCKWHKGIGDIAVEGARNHGLLNVSIDDYFNTIHRLPSLKTQKKIAMILTSFQKKNIIATNELRMLKKQKEYLLRQMFI